MISPPVPSNLTMSTSIVVPKNGYKIGRVRPDENGIYRDIPVMCLNIPSRSGEKYDPDSFWNCANDPNRQFRTSINERGLFGENGHPSFYGTAGKTEAQLKEMGVIDRFMTVDPNNVTHQIYDVRKGETLPDGAQLVLADLKPTEPKGAILKEELDDPTRSASFSVRQYSSKVPNSRGYLDSYCRALVTFDRVLIGGFKLACSAMANGLSQESLDNQSIILMDDGGKIVYDHFSIESFKDTALNEAFKSVEVIRATRSRTIIDAKDRHKSRFPGLYARNVFNEHFRNS